MPILPKQAQLFKKLPEEQKLDAILQIKNQLQVESTIQLNRKQIKYAQLVVAHPYRSKKSIYKEAYLHKNSKTIHPDNLNTLVCRMKYNVNVNLYIAWLRHNIDENSLPNLKEKRRLLQKHMYNNKNTVKDQQNAIKLDNMMAGHFVQSDQVGNSQVVINQFNTIISKADSGLKTVDVVECDDLL